MKKKSINQHSNDKLNLEDVELETNSFFHLFDSSMPLVIDSATTITNQKILIYGILFGLSMLFLSIFAPKMHYTKNYSVDIEKQQNSMVSTYYDSFGLDLFNKTISSSFKISRRHKKHEKSESEFSRRWSEMKDVKKDNVRKHHQFNKHHFHYAHNHTRNFFFRINISLYYFANGTIFKTGHIVHQNAKVPFTHHNIHSDNIDLFSLPSENAEKVAVNLNISGNFRNFGQFKICFSVNNPSCPIFEYYAGIFFGVIGITCLTILLFTCQRRLEQVGTIIFISLFMLANINLLSENRIWCLMGKIMVCFIQCYLFYLIAFVANKHRSVMTSLLFLLIFLSFSSDVVYVMKYDKTQFCFQNAYHVFWHFITISVTESMIAAMHHSIDDLCSYTIYTVLLSLSFAASLISDDLTIFFPGIHHYLNLKIFFIGVHSVIISILFLYHRSSRQKRNHRDQTSNSVARTESL